ncbi:hypothetical protein C1645_831189 [Glomus cerebriforme]|uniref:Uncharacterized protein n=1 Tax=Glomus cerebriforme TaxID=658196 RepID=A0A397SMH6_9GLOM|nr:hypothetical protein C1645_831189 [Glomus cerebriforme]
MPEDTIKIILDKVFNKSVSKPINLHPDLNYVTAYDVKCGSYNYNQIVKMGPACWSPQKSYQGGKSTRQSLTPGHIHVLVEPPVSTVTSSRELTNLTSCIDQQVRLCPRRTKSFKWTVNIEHATLEGLKNSIRVMYPTPALENNGAELNFKHPQRLSQIGLSQRALRTWTLGESDDPSL